MSRENREEPAGAVVATMEVIKGLSGDNRAFPPDELIRLSREEELTSQDLLEGFATLVYAFMGMLDEPLDLVPAVIRRLRRLQLVPDEVLPTMAGALTAAALRQSPLRWRRGLGAMAVSTHGSEALAWSYTAWLLADFRDFARGEEGATANLMAAVFANLKTEDRGEE
jgi:hypothetical protein